MNTPERNFKNAAKLEKLGQIYEESEQDKSNERRNRSALDEATREYPLPTARKFAWVVCGGFWLFCVGGLLFGVDLRALFPFLFFSLAVVAGVHIPMFLVKRKTFDVVVGVIFALSCIIVGLSMLVSLGGGV